MSEYYQTTQVTTQNQLANIIAQGSSQTITGYYNIQYVPAKNSAFEVQSSDTGYKYKQGTTDVDVTSTGTVYYRDITSTTKINSISQYNKCSIVACSGGGGGGGGGGAGFEGDQGASVQANGNYKDGGNGGQGGQGVVAVYTGIELTPYTYVTVTIDATLVGAGGAGGVAVASGYNKGQGKSYNGQGGQAGQDGSYVYFTGTKSTGSTVKLLTANGGQGGNGGEGGKGNGNGASGTNGNNGTVTVGSGLATASSTTEFASSLKVYTKYAQYQSTNYGINGNGGSDGQSGSKGNNGNSGSGAFARIYFYK
jgi:hypothetical protein